MNTKRVTEIIVGLILAASILASVVPGILDEFGRWHSMKQIYPNEVAK